MAAAQLQANGDLSREVSKYFADLLVNDQLLSTDTFTSNSAPGEKITITEEIAELELRQRQIDMKLAALANSKRDVVIDTSQSLNAATQSISEDLPVRLAEISSQVLALRLGGRRGGRKPDPGHARDHYTRDHHTRDSHARDSHARELARDQMFFNIDAVLDVLELPTLCKICVLQGNYQEALEIHTLVKMLCIKFPQQKTFLQIERRVRAELQLMFRGLVKLLNTNLKQSNILKIFQILNRPDLVDLGSEASYLPAVRERALQMLYLNSRFRFITAETANLKPLLKLKKLTYLKRYIEVYREYLFNSLLMYHAIFRSAGVDSEGSKSDRFLIHLYLRNLVGLLVQELKAHLPSAWSADDEDDDLRGQRDGVLLQLIYLCKSLEKYGFDFEPVLAWELCVQDGLVAPDDWAKNLSRVRKFRT